MFLGIISMDTYEQAYLAASQTSMIGPSWENDLLLKALTYFYKRAPS